MPILSKSSLYLAAVSLVLLAASSAAIAAPLRVCDLMTQQTAAGIFGGPVAPGRIEMSSPGVADCRFDSKGGGSSEIGVMDTKLTGMPVAAMYKVLATNPDPGHSLESISGLGEAAVLNKGPDDMTLSVLFHDKILIVSATGSKNPGVKAALIAAARQALPSI